MVSSVSPAAVPAGAADTTVTLAGSGFTSTTTVSLNGVAEATSYVSASQVTAVVPAAQLATAASLALTASNGSAASTPISFAVNNPVPAVSALSVARLTVGSVPGTITVTGTGFVVSSIVAVNGAARTTTFENGTQLYALSATRVFRYDVTAGTPVSSATAPSSLITNEGFSIAPGTENVLVLGAGSFGTTTIQVYDYDTSTNTVTARTGSASMKSHYGYCPVFLNADYLINPFNTIGDVDLYQVTSGIGSAAATYTPTSGSEQSGCMKLAGSVGYSTTGNVYAFTPTSITKTATINLAPTTVQGLDRNTGRALPLPAPGLLQNGL